MRRIFALHGQAVIRDVATPTLRYGEVLVRTHYSTVSSGTESWILRKSIEDDAKDEEYPGAAPYVYPNIRGGIRGPLEPRRPEPGLISIGYSLAGEVIEVGEGITDLAVGDLVACSGSQCSHHAELVAVPRNLVARIPEGVSVADASFVTLGAVAEEALRQTGCTFGETVVLYGMGLLGMLAGQIAQAAGLYVIGLEIDPGRRALATELGIADVHDPREADLLELVRSRTDGYGADAVVLGVVTELNGPINIALDLCRQRGRVVGLGLFGMDVERHRMWDRHVRPGHRLWPRSIRSGVRGGRRRLPHRPRSLDGEPQPGSLPAAARRWQGTHRAVGEGLRVRGCARRIPAAPVAGATAHGAVPLPRAGMSRRPLAPRDLFAVRWLSDVQLSADGERVACVETRLDEALDGLRSRILVIDVVRGTVVSSPSPIDASDRAPRWSPDGSRLAFVAARPDGTRVWLTDRDGRDAALLPGVPAGAGEPAWSPDGRSIALTVTRSLDGAPDGERSVLVEVATDDYKRDGHPVGEGRTSSAIWVVAAEGGTARALTSGTATDRRPAWSPDGHSVAFLSDRGREGRASPIVDLWLVEPASGGRDGVPPRRLTDGSGPIVAFDWSPDGARIALLGHGQGGAQGLGWRLRIIDTDGRRRSATEVPLVDDPPFALGLTVRSDDGRGMGDASLSWVEHPDGERVWTRWADGGRGTVGWIALDGQWQSVITGDRAAVSWSVASTADRIAFIASDPDDPGEVSVAALDGSSERRLSGQNRDWLAAIDLGPTEAVRATGPGEQAIEGWLTRPPVVVAGPGGRAPLIVAIHGGPHYSVGLRFSFETHRLAALGYAVLNTDPRGSLGYGEAFGRAIVGDWGGVDLADVLALTEAATVAPGVDADRLAITGVSYGGYLTLWAISQDDRFRAAISENGISDLFAAFGTSEDAGLWWLAEMAHAPWEQPMAWIDRSAVRYADRITTPLLLLHAELDQNVSIAQSEQMYAALRTLGRPVEFVRVPGEGHLMDLNGSARFRLARMDRITEFLARTL